MYENLSDKRAYSNTLGCLMLDTTLIDDIDRPLDRTDFNTEAFYELIYVAIYNLYMNGCQTIDEFSIDSYLKDYKKQYSIFQENNGLEYVNSAKAIADLGNYDYYYHRLRKYSLLRYYEKNGLNTSFIYDPSMVDKALDEENIKFDNYTEQDIVDEIENKLIIDAKTMYCTNTLTDNIQAGDGMDELIDSLLQTPDFGYSFASLALNTVSRGAKAGRLILRSASTGVGKTRNFLMDALKFACPYTYDLKKGEFIYTGNSVPTLFLGTEGSLQEFQTICLACVSGVNESHIIKGEYKKGELERVKQASKYIQECPLYLVYCDDYNITDIENIAKKYVLQYKIEIFIFDYLQTSLRLMTEMRNKTAVRMQEYQILIVFVTRLKALAERLQICILTGTQLSNEAKEARYKDSSVIQGSKSIPQKCDVCLIISEPNRAEQSKLEALTRNMVGMPTINLLQWIYKCRRGEYTRVVIASHVDLGTMRIKDCFVTNFDLDEVINMDFTDIKAVDKMIKEHSVDAKVVEAQLSDNPEENNISSNKIKEDKIEKEVPFEEENETKKRNFDW